MNAPAKRFSLQRLLTSPTPAPAPAPIPAPVRAEPPPPVVVAPTPVELIPSPETVALPEPPPLRPLSAAPARIAKSADLESHPKKKRSYSVDMKLCEDLEILSWYQSRSSSSVVEELIRKHLQHNKSVLMKAREIRSAR
jgi:hypothetical protein